MDLSFLDFEIVIFGSELRLRKVNSNTKKKKVFYYVHLKFLSPFLLFEIQVALKEVGFYITLMETVSNLTCTSKVRAERPSTLSPALAHLTRASVNV